ncbi:MAG TPA: spermidine synthase [Burkholderiaceae bacterium]|nr:spermidine synthase [Burkholderiaceae bacterium]
MARRRKPVGVTLSEEAGVRYLHFGTEWIQGGMRVARPYALEIPYQQEMMAPGLFLPEPRRIVQLGLGAAALTKFCYRNVPGADVVVVELSQEVIDAARGWFLLPDDDARLTVVHEDARDFIARPKQRGRADWLQVDLYDKDARGPVFDDVEFYRICRAALGRPGVACFNLFGRRFDPSFARICAAFDDRALALPEVDEGNRIVLAFNGPPLVVPIAALLECAAELEARWHLPARRWVSGLCVANGLGKDLSI